MKSAEVIFKRSIKFTNIELVENEAKVYFAEELPLKYWRADEEKEVKRVALNLFITNYFNSFSSSDIDAVFIYIDHVKILLKKK